MWLKCFHKFSATLIDFKAAVCIARHMARFKHWRCSVFCWWYNRMHCGTRSGAL